MVLRHAARRADAVGVEPSAPGRKRSVSRPTRGAFGVRSVVFAVGGMSSSARRRLAERFRSELAGVRALLKRAAEFLAPAGAGNSGLATSSSSPRAAPCGGGKDGWFLVAGIRSGGAPVEAGRKKMGKKRKASFLLEREDAPKMAPDGRKRLAVAARLASLSTAELPAQIGELLQRKRHGSSGKADIEVHSKDDAALSQLKQQLDKFTEEARNHGHEPMMDASAVIHPSPSPRQRQEVDGKIAVEEDEDLDICGGASPIPTALAPLLPDIDYSELVGATGVKLLSPLQPKYIALAERPDVCGGASTVAPALSSLLPAGHSELVGATGVKLLSPLPRKYVELAERVHVCGVVSPTATALPSLLTGHSDLADAIGAKMLSPLPRKYVALAERVDVCDGVATTATTLPSLLPGHTELADAAGAKMLSLLPRKYVALAERVDVATTATTLPSLLPEHNELVDATGVKMLSPLPHKYVALAEEDDEYVDICGDASPVVLPKNHVEIISISKSPSSSSSSDSDSYSDGGSSSSTSSDSNSETSAAGSTPASAIPTNACVSSAQQPAPEVAQSTKLEEKLPDQRASSSTPAPAIPTNACVSSAQPPEPAAPEVAQSAEQEVALPDQRAATATASPKPLTNLIARAQGAVARRRHEEMAQAREKARQELLDMERTALATTSNAIHPLDMKLLGLAAVEYMVSTDEEVRRTLSYSSDSTAIRSAAPSCLSLLENLGLFLKADDGSDKEQQQQLQQPRFIVGADDDVEEGEIR